MSAVAIREVLPRDGFQDIDRRLPTEVKTAVVERLWRAGFDWIEITSMVSPRRLPQFDDAAEVCAAAAGLEGLKRSVFVPNRRGLERAVAAGCEEVSLAVAATDSLSRENFGVDRETALGEILAVAEDARTEGLETSVTVGGAFGCPFEGQVAPETVLEIAERIVAAGSDCLLLADTIAAAGPGEVGSLTSEVAQRFPETTLGIHLHGGLDAVERVMEAFEAGAEVIDSAMGGAGGCPFVPDAPGNVPTEALVARLAKAGVENLPGGGGDLYGVAREVTGMTSKEGRDE